MKRTHNCYELTKLDIGKEVVLSGWVDTRRDHGGLIFIDLRDRTGITQLVFNPQLDLEIHKMAEGLRSEYVISVKGKVEPRPAGTNNLKLVTGEIEVSVAELQVLNKSRSLPFPIEGDTDISEDVRLAYRFVDLRRPQMFRALEIRHKACQAARKFLDEEGFLEIETPMLTKSTPEGARDYLVPSRVYPGKFYALPQSPQLFKQILMVSGFEKYFQIVKCFRDEDLRADRQPEFTQIDMELSFASENDVLDVTERLMARMFMEAIDVKLKLPFKRLAHSEAMNLYGSDKPDLRWDLQLVDLTKVFTGIEFKVFSNVINSGGVIKAIALPGAGELSRKQMDDLVVIAQELGAKGLAWIKVTEKGWEGPIQKFITGGYRESLQKLLNLQPGDLCLFVADTLKIANSVLGSLRLKLIKQLKIKPKNQFSFCWITDFPLFNYDEEAKRLNSEHHPFTAPKENDLAMIDSDPLKVKASSYDLVLNGYEMASGSVRIHQPELQQKIFDLLQLNKEEVQERFGFFLKALEYGAPPHAGIAPGLDRLIMVMVGGESIRDVIAFPKTQRAICPLTGSPTEVSPKQLKELGLKIV